MTLLRLQQTHCTLSLNRAAPEAISHRFLMVEESRREYHRFLVVEESRREDLRTQEEVKEVTKFRLRLLCPVV